MAKYFPGYGLWRGHVYEIDDDDGELTYSVIYTDGDTEDYTPSECMKHVQMYCDLENGVLNEWEIGNE